MIVSRTGAGEARKCLRHLLDAAEHGQSIVITRRGKPIATLVPISSGATPPRQALLPLAGSGRGLWGRDSASTLGRLRDEWSR